MPRFKADSGSVPAADARVDLSAISSRNVRVSLELRYVETLQITLLRWLQSILTKHST